MTTLGQLVERIHSITWGGHRPTLNILNANAAVSASSLQMRHPLGPIGHNAWLAVGTEMFYVIADPTGQTIPVIPSMLGTVAQAHVAGDLVEVNPRFSPGLIAQLVVDEIASWPTSLFAVAAPITVNVSAGTRAYNLAGIDPEFLDVLNVVRSPDRGTGSAGSGSWPRVGRFRVDRNADLTSFPSGVSLTLESPYQIGTTIRVVYSVPFLRAATVVTPTTNLEATLLLRRSMLDLIVYGVLWRLMSGAPIGRTDDTTNLVSGTQEENPTQLVIMSADQLSKLREKRLGEEIRRCRELVHVRA